MWGFSFCSPIWWLFCTVSKDIINNHNEFLVQEKTTDVDVDWYFHQSGNHNFFGVWDFCRSPHVKGFKCISLTIHEERHNCPSAAISALMHQLLYIRISQKLTRINKQQQRMVTFLLLLLLLTACIEGRGCSLVYLS